MGGGKNASIWTIWYAAGNLNWLVPFSSTSPKRFFSQLVSETVNGNVVLRNVDSAEKRSASAKQALAQHQIGFAAREDEGRRWL